MSRLARREAVVVAGNVDKLSLLNVSNATSLKTVLFQESLIMKMIRKMEHDVHFGCEVSGRHFHFSRCVFLDPLKREPVQQLVTALRLQSMEVRQYGDFIMSDGHTCKNIASTLSACLASLAGEDLTSTWLMDGERGALFGLVVPPGPVEALRRLLNFLVM